MTIRRTLAALLASSLALTAAACSDDGSDEGSGSTTTSTTVEQTTTTLSDEEFDARADEAAVALEAAGADLCAVGPALQSMPMAPSTPAQMERMLHLFQQALEMAASALEPTDPQSAAALRDAASGVIAEAEAADYDLSLMSGDSVLESLQSTDYLQASAALDAKYKADCGTPGGEQGSPSATETTVPQSAPQG